MRTGNSCHIKTAISSLYLCLLIFPSLAACSRQPVYPEPPRIGQNLSIDVTGLQEGVPQFFAYHYQNKTINFFIVKKNEDILSCLDACKACYPKKLGFRFDKGSIVCRACNERYPVSDIDKGVGNCYPIRLGGYEKNGTYLIPVSSLEKMADKF